MDLQAFDSAGLSLINPFTSQLHTPPPETAPCICPQDVHKPSTDSTTTSLTSSNTQHTQHTDESPSSPADSSAPSKKKRKSWGQVLPEPTTNLPPRKRAKTEAEKEQRKYERVQRNRQAAHNSRMRKQHEMDHLSKRNTQLEEKCISLQATIKRLERELRQAQGLDTQAPPSPTESMRSQWSNSAPSLCDPASPTDTTLSLDQAHTPSTKMEAEPLFDVKQLDDSHSAEMCSQQWTSTSRSDQIRLPPLVMA